MVCVRSSCSVRRQVPHVLFYCGLASKDHYKILDLLINTIICLFLLLKIRKVSYRFEDIYFHGFPFQIILGFMRGFVGDNFSFVLHQEKLIKPGFFYWFFRKMELYCLSKLKGKIFGVSDHVKNQLILYSEGKLSSGDIRVAEFSEEYKRFVCEKFDGLERNHEIENYLVCIGRFAPSKRMERLFSPWLIGMCRKKGLQADSCW